ncbi:MAG: aldo/keto reductase [Pseudomonadota bacterium]
MQSIRFGRTDLTVSRLCFGCVSFGVADPARGWDPFSAEGRALGIRLIRAARDRGVTLFDVSPDYGDGHAEMLLGEALRRDRDRAVIATKVDYGGRTAAEVTASVEASLRRLGTDCIDLVQFHGGNYPPASVKRILERGLLDALLALRAEGKIRHVGLTVADPVTARTLIETGAFDAVQMMYSLAEQAAARHALDWCAARDLGVTVMRPLAAGMLAPLFAALAPRWAESHDLAEVCLKFLLCDPRVHTLNVGMRSEAELGRNADLIDGFVPPIDVAALPRSVGAAARRATVPVPARSNNEETVKAP